MRIRIYPEGDVGSADTYSLSVGDLGMAEAPEGAVPNEWRLSETMGLYAREYAREWGMDQDGRQNMCVEPDDEEATALPGWHAAEEGDDDGGDDPPRPFRLYVLTAEVKWSACEVATFNSAKVSP